jgi:hypothetical protein
MKDKTFIADIALRIRVKTEGTGAAPPDRGGTPAPRPNLNSYRYTMCETITEAGFQLSNKSDRSL